MKKEFFLVIFISINAFVNAQSTYKNKFVNKSVVKLFAEDSAWSSKLLKAFHEIDKNKNKIDTLYIDFHEGVYPIYKTIQFTRDKTSSNETQIVLRPVGKVIFSGARKLDPKKFKPTTDLSILETIIDKPSRSKILEYDLSQDGFSELGNLTSIGFGRKATIPPAQVYYNNQRLTLARYPNKDLDESAKLRRSVLSINKIFNKGLSAIDLPIGDSSMLQESTNKPEFEYTDTRISKWNNSNDIWVDGIFSRDWSWSFNKIQKIDTVKHSISLTFDEKYDLTNNNSFFFASNVLEELDMPGEYFIDRKRGMLYIYPPLDFDVNASSFQITNSSTDLFNLKFCKNIRFDHFTFEMGRSKAVQIVEGNNISFGNCIFRFFGSGAISVQGINNKILNCNIYDIGGTAISLNGGDFNTLTAAKNIVSNCNISNWANINRVYTPAISLYGVGNMVVQNSIHHAPHGAITISGNNHVIEKNEIYKVLLEFKDFGAIYGFLGKNQLMRGHIIKGNYFHDIGQIGEGVYAIYADEGTSNWHICDNVFYKIGNAGARVSAILGNTSSYLKVDHNLFLDCSETFEESFHFSTWGQKRYHDYFINIWKEAYTMPLKIADIYLQQYPELAHFMQEDRVYVNTNQFTNNILSNKQLQLNHSNYFMTKSDLPNADSLIIAYGNKKIVDFEIQDYLENWNSHQTSNKKKKPKMLLEFAFFKSVD